MSGLGSVFGSPRRAGVLLFLLLLICYGYFFPRWADWNQNSRFDLVRAVVEQHTTVINQYADNTGDYAQIGDQRYSDKAPGMAILGVPVYAAFHQAVPASLITDRFASIGALDDTLNPNGTGATPDKLYAFLGLTVTTYVTTALPAAILAVLMFWLTGAFGWSVWQRFAAAALYSLATNAFAYANTFVGHQTVAALLFAAFTTLFAIRLGKLSRRWLYTAGFLLGYALITEYQSGLVIAVIGVYALLALRAPVDTAIRMIIAGVPAVLLLVLHDMAAFGTPLPIGYFHSALWMDVHGEGFVSLTYPRLDALVGILFGAYRGLLFLSPYLAFAAVGYIALWRRQPARRAEFWVLLLSPIVYLLFNASSAMWEGGFAVGPRYVVASLPFLGVAAGAGIWAAWRRPFLRPVIVLAIAWSFFAVWAETIAGQSFPDYTHNPLFDLSLPVLLQGDIARNAGMLLKLTGWFSLLPLLMLALASVVVCGVLPLDPRFNREPRRDLARSSAGVGG